MTQDSAVDLKEQKKKEKTPSTGMVLTLFLAGSERFGIGRTPPPPCQVSKTTRVTNGKRRLIVRCPLKDL